MASRLKHKKTAKVGKKELKVRLNLVKGKPVAGQPLTSTEEVRSIPLTDEDRRAEFKQVVGTIRERMMTVMNDALSVDKFNPNAILLAAQEVFVSAYLTAYAFADRQDKFEEARLAIGGQTLIDFRTDGIRDMGTNLLDRAMAIFSHPTPSLAAQSVGGVSSTSTTSATIVDGGSGKPS